MSDRNDILAELQAADLKARHEAHDYFADVAIIARDDGTAADAQAMALGFMTPTGSDNKIGACGIIEQPEYVDDKFKGTQDGPMRMNWRILWLENRLINADTDNGGTGKRALALARHSRRLIKNYHAGGLTNLFTFDRIARVPGAIYYDELKDEQTGLVCWACEFHGLEGDFVPYLKCANVRLSPGEGAAPQTVTVSGGESGGTILYSLDGTYPSLAAGATIDVPSAALLRVLSRQTGFIDSDVIAANFT